MPRIVRLISMGAVSIAALGAVGALSGRTLPVALAQAPAAQSPPATSNQSTAPAPLVERAPDALKRVTWRTRTLVGDDRLTRWKLAIRPDGLSLLDAVVRADAAIVNFVEATSTQQVGGGIAKTLGADLTAADIAAIRVRMGTIRLLTYRVDALAPDAAARRKTFELARAMGAETIVVPANTSLDGLDTLADELGLNVAVLSADAKPATLMAALAGKSARLGVGVDTGVWAQAGVAPKDALPLVKDRLLYVNLRDRSGTGANAKNVRLGTGKGQLEAFFLELDRLDRRPLSMTLDTTGLLAAPGDLFPAIDAFETAVQKAYGENFTRFSKTRPIRWDLVSPRDAAKMTPEAIKKESEAIRQKIVAAVPRQPYAAPKKPRTLLVIESLHGMSHNTIPHTNVMLEQLGAVTGAWKTEFSNDLDKLKYPNIKKYDGIFLNSIVGELFAEPAVREGLARFVREGGGIGGIHGTPWASRNWDEFADMIGSQDAPHRIERGVMKVYDPASPIMKPFGSKPITLAEEYYRFEHEGPERLRWDQVRVLMTVDLDDPAVEPRRWTGYKRPDRIYPVSWIRTWGKGRVFYTSLGHMPETFMMPELVGHCFAGVQYLLGDLAADATPNPPGTSRASR